jgi:hypothetical protein
MKEHRRLAVLPPLKKHCELELNFSVAPGYRGVSQVPEFCCCEGYQGEKMWTSEQNVPGGV